LDACSLHGYKDPAIALIRAGVNVNAIGANGWTPLIAAAFCGGPYLSRGGEIEDCIEILDALLQAGADASVRTREGKTAMDIKSYHVKDVLTRLQLAEFRPY
jgi:ankyrin repeat protein